MSWRDRAVPITDPERLKKYKAVASRSANPLISSQEMEVYEDPSMVSEIVKGVGSAVVDSAIVLPDNYTLGGLSALSKKLDPEDRYGKMVRQARKDSPIATTFTDIITPLPPPIKALSALKRGGMAQDLATSVASQIFNEGEIGADRTALDLAGGRILGGAGRLIRGKQPSQRARSLGIKDLEQYARKGKGHADENLEVILEDLERTNLFKRGRVSDYDPSSGQFKVSEDMKSQVLPPSTKELRNRLNAAREKVGKETGALLDEFNFYEVTDDLFENSPHIQDWLQKTGHKSDALNPRHKILEDSRRRLFGDNFDQPASLKDIDQEKRHMYKLLSGDYAKANLSNPDREAFMEYARVLRDTAENALPPTVRPKFNDLNKQYENFSSIYTPLDKKSQGQFLQSGYTPTLFGSGEYQATRNIMDAVGDASSGVRAQIGRSYDDGGALRTLSDAVRSSTVPSLRNMGDDESRRYTPINQRQPQSLDTDAIFREVKIPRTTEGVLENKDVLLQKISRFAPEMLETALQVVNSPVEEIQDQLPLLVTQFPQLFAPDKYGRVDGIIVDPAMQEKARRDIRYDNSLPSSQKAIYLNGINQNGRLEGY